MVFHSMPTVKKALLDLIEFNTLKAEKMAFDNRYDSFKKVSRCNDLIRAYNERYQKILYSFFD